MRIVVMGASGLVGSQVVAQAAAAGFDVVRVSRGDGIDVLAGDDLGPCLDGADAVIDVLQCPDLEEHAASAFFTVTARRIAAAVSSAGVPRVVLLSIIGVDRSSGEGVDTSPASTEGYYRAKRRQELVARERGGDVRVVRSAPFHNFVGQVLGRAAARVVADVSDMPVQPVEVSAVVDVLLAHATGARAESLSEVAGPRVERLPALAREFADHYFDDQQIVTVPASPALAGGLLLPGPDALIVGRSFREWLRTHARE
jgi:uncharacterized protein YbjT (DUF2867 family)